MLRPGLSFVDGERRPLDITAITDTIQAKDPRWVQPYDPLMMVVLLLYAYCTGRPSSRKIERATYEDVPFGLLADGHHPNHSTITSFRKDHLEALARLFVQVLRLCQGAGLVTLGRVAPDGYKAMSYPRILGAGTGAGGDRARKARGGGR